MDLLKFMDLTKHGESEKVEFKRSVTSDIGAEICSLANALGGHLFIGMDDDGRIIGCDARNAKEKVSQFISSIVPPILVSFDVIRIEDKEVLSIEVPQGRELYSIGGIAYIKIGTSKRPLSMQEIFMMGAENVLFEMDLTPMEGSEMDRDLIDHFFHLGSSRVKDGSSYLKKKGFVTEDDRPTLASFLFFTREPQMKLPHTSLRLIRPGMNWKRYTGPLWKIVDEFQSDLTSIVSTFSIQVGFKRVDIPEYPFLAVREGVINALVHRNYAIKSEVFVEIGDGTLEIRNPGSFPPGSSPQMPKPVPRNPAIYELMFEAGYVERQGRGIDLIRSECEKDPFIEYEYELAPNHTTLRFKRVIDSISSDNRDIINILSRGSLSSTDLSAQVGISKPTMVKRLKELSELNIVVSSGKGPSRKYSLADWLQKQK